MFLLPAFAKIRVSIYGQRAASVKAAVELRACSVYPRARVVRMEPTS